jgi:hypothetical protein
MKNKKWFKPLLIVLAVLVVYILFNQIDIKATPMKEEESQPPALAANDGFYLLSAMQEPDQVDVYQPQVVKRYNQLYFSKEVDKNFINQFQFDRNQKRIWQKGPESEKQMRAINWPGDFRQDKCLHVLQHKAILRQMQQEKKVFLERYKKLLESVTFNDLSTVKYMDIKSVPLLHWLRLTKLYTSIQLADALDGNWKPAVANLIKQINFVKRHNKSARLYVTSLIFKAVAKIPLWGLASLMNQPNCPDEVYEHILQGLPDMTYEEFGTTSMANYEGIPGVKRYFKNRTYLQKMPWLERLSYKLLMQNNRTQQYWEDYYHHIIRYEKTPPYQWEGDFKPKNPKRGLIWWLQNPVGKIWYSHFLKGSHRTMAFVLKSYSLLTTHDMVRISADLHLHYNPDKSIEENLKGLKTYQTLLDPCSGKPYIWHDKKQILYSLGTDRDDDGGKGDPITSLDTDFVLPVIIYLNR